MNPSFEESCAKLRYKLWRASGLVFLGRCAGRGISGSVIRSIDEFMPRPDFRGRVLERRLIDEAYVQSYAFPNSFPPNFPRSEAFSERSIYLLRDVSLSPRTGFMWIPEIGMLQQSMGSVPRLYADSLTDALRSAPNLDCDAPVVVLPDVSYYHLLIEGVPQVLLALDAYPDAKVLVRRNHSKLLESILSYFGIGENSVLQADGPVTVGRAVLVPRWVNGGFVPRGDVAVLKNALENRVRNVDGTLKIYISRAHSPNRRLVGESELEKRLVEIGFNVLYFEDMSFSEQMDAVHGASMVVAPHGAGLSNLIAARSGTRVVELLSENWFNTCYAKLAVQMGLSYRFISTEPDVSGNYGVPVEKVMDVIASVL